MTTNEIMTKLAAISCCPEFADVESAFTLAEQLREIADAAENMQYMAHQVDTRKFISVTDEG